MLALFSPNYKYTTWRRLWLALAKAEKAIGLPITSSQIQEIEKHLTPIDYKRVEELEAETHHDVMAHLLAFGEMCPEAKGILHLGATSAFVTDNTDLIQMREALKLIQNKLHQLLTTLKEKAEEHADLATIGYTHFQTAQPTTVGKRMCLWLQDLLFDYKDLLHKQEDLAFLGLKGATGTQASFSQLAGGDLEKAHHLDQLVAIEMGFANVFTISGQTYTRKQDMRILSALEGLAASAHKCATDIRLLSHTGELQESFSSKQVGSSAMPHKRNPILSERVCALSRYLMTLAQNGPLTLATQWLERSLDDSANRRLAIPEAFLTADAILSTLTQILSHLNVNKHTIEQNLSKELPRLSLENILMACSLKGKDRQVLHERLKAHSQLGEKMAQAIAEDAEIDLSKEEIESCMKVNTGRAAAQVAQFIEEEVNPVL